MGGSWSVTPTERHLHELELLKVHPEKRERLVADLGEPAAERSSSSRSSSTTSRRSCQMGPNAHHHERHGPAGVTVSVTVTTFRG